VAVPHTLPVSPGERWQVVLHDDDHNQFPVVHHLLRKICGLDWVEARLLSLTVHEHGGAVTGVHDRETAEALTVELLRHGLSASCRRAT
jgi:ATP-dependent Clp protease adapter protein ClpS